ncbi:hypothetical protein LPU83_pLPU83d_1592 (plasmid) [Rhizobium favelukesii]|uniref:Uncharacterized protein n=1 Tax=Rhizobium favelukesii TaxID=348824 RepID=W6RPK0_9HYPH|nr:hypothetical protein LPU83_pLPU83d_1592 [Rhizobium favelukesii]
MATPASKSASGDIPARRAMTIMARNEASAPRAIPAIMIGGEGKAKMNTVTVSRPGARGDTEHFRACQRIAGHPLDDEASIAAAPAAMTVRGSLNGRRSERSDPTAIYQPPSVGPTGRTAASIAKKRAQKSRSASDGRDTRRRAPGDFAVIAEGPWTRGSRNKRSGPPMSAVAAPVGARSEKPGTTVASGTTPAHRPAGRLPGANSNKVSD